MSTIGLISNCDIAILNGGSAAVEAAALGKKVVNLGAAPYKGSSFCINISAPDDIDKFFNSDSQVSSIRNYQSMMRYVYTALARFPQFCQFVRASETTTYKAYDGADIKRLENIILSGEIEADDEEFADTDADELEVAELLERRDWLTLSALAEEFSFSEKNLLSVKQKLPYHYINKIRPMLKRGDI